jgi:hypothetical protein
MSIKLKKYGLLVTGLAGFFHTSFAIAIPCDFKDSDVFNSVCAYVESESATIGGSLKLHVSSSKPTFSVAVRRAGENSPILQTTTFNNGVKYALKNNSYLGLNWGSGHVVTIPNAWHSAMYELIVNNGVEVYSEFVAIKSNKPGSYSKVLVLDDSTTNMAYTPIGGKSLYGFNSSNYQAATRVSFERPAGRGQWNEVRQFVAWLDANGIAYEAASMMDLQRNPALLKNYNLVMIVGHNEYWSKTMRDAWDSYLASGGNAAIFGGNTMWWQVRFNMQTKQMICYKDPYADPLLNIDNSRVTSNWYGYPVNRPENTSIGVSFRHGGYHDYTDNGVQHYVKDGAGDDGSNGGFRVSDATHWIFNGTGLKNGDVFGRQYTVAGYEVDGALFKMLNGMPVVTGADGTPLNFKIAAITPAYAVNAPSGIEDVIPNNYQKHGWATIGVFQPFAKGGTVFVAPTVDWGEGLNEAPVGKITANVINKLKVRNQ